MVRKLSIVIVVALALVAACGKGTDLTRVKAEAFEQVSPYGPKISGLIGRHADLKARAAKLPADQAGVAEVSRGLEAQHATIAHLKELLDGYAAAVDKAAKTGKKAEVQSATAAVRAEMDKGVADVEAAFTSASSTLDALEQAAKAAAEAPVDAGISDGGAAPTSTDGGSK